MFEFLSGNRGIFQRLLLVCDASIPKVVNPLDVLI